MSDLLTQFGQQPQTLLTNIGSGIAQLGGGLIDQAVNRKNQEAYSTAMGNWEQDQTTENYKALMNASRPLGIYEQTVADIEAMDAITQKNRLERNGKMLGAVESGNTKSLLNLLTEERDALIAEGESAEAKGVQNSIDMVEAGDIDSFAKNLKILTGIIPGGTDLLDNIKSLSEEEREEGEYWTGLLETGAGLDKSQEQLNEMLTAYENDSKLVAEAPSIGTALRFATAVEGGYSPESMEVTKLMQGLNGDFFKRSEGYNKAVVADQQFQDTYTRSVEAAANPNTTKEQQGALDIKMLNVWMRQIDDATVRQDDVNNIAGANALLEQAKLFAEKIKGGSVLTPDQRATMARLSQDYLNAHTSFVEKQVFPSIYAGYKALDPSPDDKRYKEVFGDWPKPNGEEPKKKVEEDKAADLNSAILEIDPTAQAWLDEGHTEYELYKEYPSAYKKIYGDKVPEQEPSDKTPTEGVPF